MNHIFMMSTMYHSSLCCLSLFLAVSGTIEIRIASRGTSGVGGSRRRRRVKGQDVQVDIGIRATEGGERNLTNIIAYDYYSTKLDSYLHTNIQLFNESRTNV